MKNLILFSIVFLYSILSLAQDKIVISYDQNGNRILRERICVGCRPAPPVDSVNELTGIVDSKLTQSTEAGQGTFQVYPNPSNNKFYLSLDAFSLEQKCQVILTDQLGKEHFRRQVKDPISPIETEQLADGLYYLTIIRGNQTDIVKLVKESGH